MIAQNYDTLKSAFDVLKNYGLTFFKPEYRKETDPYDAAGISLSQISRPCDVAQLAYSAWEDMNAHDWCACLDFFTHLYGSWHIGDLERLSRLLNQEIEVKTEYDTDKQEYKTKRYRAILTFEEIED